MNLFKMLFLISLMIGLDYQSTAQICPPQCCKMGISASNNTSVNQDQKDATVSSKLPESKSSIKCIPEDCPHICKVICKATCEKINNETSATQDTKSVIVSNIALLPAKQHALIEAQSISLE